MTLNEAAKIARDAAKHFLPSMVEASEHASQIGYVLAVQQSSGGYSTTYLRDILNHPYGIGPANKKGPRGPIPYGDPTIINSQSGEFRRSWRIGLNPVSGEFAIMNFSPKARAILSGTIIRRVWSRSLSKKVSAASDFGRVIPRAYDVKLIKPIAQIWFDEVSWRLENDRRISRLFES
jgi:hypothetical protein